MSAPDMEVKEDTISFASLHGAAAEPRQPPRAVAALSVHARLQTLINLPDWAEPLLMKQLILRAGGMFHHLVHSCDSSIP